MRINNNVAVCSIKNWLIMVTPLIIPLLGCFWVLYVSFELSGFGISYDFVPIFILPIIALVMFFVADVFLILDKENDEKYKGI